MIWNQATCDFKNRVAETCGYLHSVYVSRNLTEEERQKFKKHFDAILNYLAKGRDKQLRAEERAAKKKKK